MDKHIQDFLKKIQFDKESRLRHEYVAGQTGVGWNTKKLRYPINEHLYLEMNHSTKDGTSGRWLDKNENPYQEPLTESELIESIKVMIRDKWITAEDILGEKGE